MKMFAAHKGRLVVLVAGQVSQKGADLLLKQRQPAETHQLHQQLCQSLVALFRYNHTRMRELESL